MTIVSMHKAKGKTIRGKRYNLGYICSSKSEAQEIVKRQKKYQQVGKIVKQGNEYLVYII